VVGGCAADCCAVICAVWLRCKLQRNPALTGADGSQADKNSQKSKNDPAKISEPKHRGPEHHNTGHERARVLPGPRPNENSRKSKNGPQQPK
jgi:hypothetical protein